MRKPDKLCLVLKCAIHFDMRVDANVVNEIRREGMCACDAKSYAVHCTPRMQRMSSKKLHTSAREGDASMR